METSKVRRMADKAMEKLVEAVEEGKSSQMQAYLAMLGRFHRYSLGNVLLIASQRPGATRVAGYRTWKQLGRQVKQGEKGIRILAPIVIRKKEETVSKDEDDVIAFKAACVFDVSQTEGREAWIGKTNEVLLSVSAQDRYAAQKGNLLGVRPGKPARVVARGYKFNHVGVSRCGEFFCCDDWQGSFKVVIGSTRTGKTAVVCDSKTKPSRSQNTHPHAYLTPDLKWVIFNSNRSGFAHVHAASVPEKMVRSLREA